MKIVTGARMREIDRITIEDYGFPAAVLMENAGRTMAQCILQLCPTDTPFLIICGRGNNGGDGLVVARYLLQAGHRVDVLLCGQPETLSPDACVNFKILRTMKIPYRFWKGELPPSGEIPDNRVWIVDALLGTGLQGPVKGDKKKLIEWINRQKNTVISLDTPSGLITDGGENSGTTVSAAHTLTVELPKAGMFAATACGRITILKCGFPAGLLTDPALSDEWLESSAALELLPKRGIFSHKKSNGEVLIIAGSRRYMGAAILAAMGVRAGGAGLIRLVYPAGAADNPSLTYPWLICSPAEDSGSGVFTTASLPEIKKSALSADSVVIGPGLDRDPETTAFLEKLLPELRRAVFDADGLWHLAGLFGKRSVDLPPYSILTPHPGELRTLLGEKFTEQDIVKFSASHRTVLTAKDWQTKVYSPEGNTRLITGGSPALATAGTGDVLAGLSASLLARGLNPFDAASLAGYLHASAGSCLASERGEDGLDPVNLANTVPLMRDLLKNTPAGAPAAGKDSLIFPFPETE